MSASSAAISSFAKPAELKASKQPVRETVVMLIERGQKTDEFGWLNGFDGFDKYLGRMS